MSIQKSFDVNHVFLTLGHGDNYNTDRFELKQNQYGAIPTKCGEFSIAEYASNISENLPNIPIPSQNVSLQNVAEQIPFTFFKDIKKISSIQIYRPKRTNNSILSSAIYTMPNIPINLISYWQTKNIKFTITHKEQTFTDCMQFELNTSGVIPILKEKYIMKYKYIQEPDLYKPIKNLDNILALDFISYIKECLQDSIISFDDLLQIALLFDYKKIKEMYGVLSESDTDFSLFIELKNQKNEFLREQNEEFINKLSIINLLELSIPLSFIYEFISNEIIKKKPYLLILPVCRQQSNTMTRRNKAKQRRVSINYRRDPLYNMNNPQNPQNAENSNTNYQNPTNPYMSSTEDPRQPLSGGRRITRRRRRV